MRNFLGRKKTNWYRTGNENNKQYPGRKFHFQDDIIGNKDRISCLRIKVLELMPSSVIAVYNPPFVLFIICKDLFFKILLKQPKHLPNS